MFEEDQIQQFATGVLQIHAKTLEHEQENHLPVSHRHLVRTDFLRRCLGMSPKLATAQLPTVPQPCFSKMAADDQRSGQSSSVQMYKEAIDEARG